MGSPQALDIEGLSAPISEESPVGADLRADTSPTSLYYLIKDARNRARADERKLEEDPDNADTRPDWKPVYEQSLKALKQTSKDLEVAAYLVEAVVRSHSLAGLRDGLILIRTLCEKYWDQGLYPMPDEDGIETRVFPLTGLNGAGAPGTLVAPIERVEITASPSTGKFAYFQYRDARNVAALPPDQQERKFEQGSISVDTFERAVAETPADFYQNLLDDVHACVDEFYKLTEFLDDKCGSQTPPTTNIRNALQELQEAIERIAKEKIFVPSDEGAADGGAGTTAAADGGSTGPGVAVGSIRTREDALRTLSLAAEFFRRTEPHTPLSFALDQVVRWGRMPLPALLSELIPDTTARDQLFRMVGISQPEEQ